ncbi:Hypothetical_protein [Hexamita inflata]|uniref:Hypothetical_protein n=1 Tax=Hexamita inflata TaxID=28002 RepID=A0AA86U5R4_9EUKA|nr:Hypothetical protein HINF_LOCUS19008 [Hexamita inflata]
MYIKQMKQLKSDTKALVATSNQYKSLYTADYQDFKLISTLLQKAIDSTAKLQGSFQKPKVYTKKDTEGIVFALKSTIEQKNQQIAKNQQDAQVQFEKFKAIEQENELIRSNVGNEANLARLVVITQKENESARTFIADLQQQLSQAQSEVAQQQLKTQQAKDQLTEYINNQQPVTRPVSPDSKMAQLQADKAALEQTVQKLKAELSILPRNEMRPIDKQRESQIQSLQKQVEQLRANIVSSEQQAKTTQTELQTQIDQKNIEIKNLCVQMNRIKQDAESTKQMKDNETQNSVQQLSIANKQLTKEKETLTNSVENLTTQLENLKLQSESTNQRLILCTTELRTKTSDLLTKTGLLQQQTADMAGLRSEIQSLQFKITVLKQTNGLSQAQEQIGKLTIQIENQTTEITNLQQQKKDLETSSRTLEKKYFESEQKFKDTNAVLQKCESAKKDFENQLQENSKSCINMKNEATQAQAQLQQKIDSQNLQIKQINNETQKHQSEIQKLESQLKYSSQALQASEQKVKKLTLNYQQQISQLDQQLKETKMKADHLQSVINSYQNGGYTRDTESKVDKYSKQQYEQQNADLITAKQKIKDLEEKIVTMENENKALNEQFQQIQLSYQRKLEEYKSIATNADMNFQLVNKRLKDQQGLQVQITQLQIQVEQLQEQLQEAEQQLQTKSNYKNLLNYNISPQRPKTQLQKLVSLQEEKQLEERRQGLAELVMLQKSVQNRRK